jgi:hypothetical protein
VKVTDPAHPLFGRRFRIESISRSDEAVAHVFVRRDDGIILRVPLRATDRSTLVNHAPRAKLCGSAVAEFLDLVKEYGLCPENNQPKPTKSGRRSTKNRDNKS